LQSFVAVDQRLQRVLGPQRGAPRAFLNMRSVLLTAFVTVFAYGGFMWSEVIYDQQIIAAFSSLRKGS
jgi:predicted secreted protein